MTDQPATIARAGLKQPLWGQLLLLLALLLPGLALRYWGFATETQDYTQYLKGWYENGLQTLHDPNYNYSPLYLYMMVIAKELGFTALAGIKLLSVLLDFYLLAAVMALGAVFSRKAMWWSAALVWYAPTVILNGAWWGQCDAFYTGSLVWGLVCLIRQRWGWMALFFALAFCAKLQAVFALSALLPLWLMGAIRWRQVALMAVVTPCVVAAVLLPAIVVFGADPYKMLTVYTAQVGWYGDRLNFNAPTFNMVLMADYIHHLPNDYPVWRDVVFWGGFALAATGLMVMTLWSWLRLPAVSPVLVVQTMAVPSILVPYFLSEMHERYFYPAEILVLVLATISPAHRLPALAIIATSTLAYMPYLYGYNVSMPMLGLLMGLVLWRVLRLWVQHTMRA